MHALRKIHRSLTATGVLLDLHPEPRDSRAEVAREGRLEIVGGWDQEEDLRDIRLARAQLDLAESEGFFVTDRQVSFDMLEHYPSVEDWLDHRTERGETAAIGEELVDKARNLLANGGELIIREAIRASLLRRLPRD